ncbi:MAG: phosphotransferase [marine benthic group bacterium]|nr:phosphotransferase [Gemmatimonadota bacterium]
MRERIIELFRSHFGSSPEAVLELAGDGSSRRYHRIRGPDGVTAIGGTGPDREENRAFLSYSASLRGVGLPVPEIYAADEDAGVWIEEDLGDTTLYSAIEEARSSGSAEGFPEAVIPAYERVLDWLPRFQLEGHEAVDYSVAYPRAAFDRQSIQWDLNYFKYHFLKLAHIAFNEQRLERDFETLTRFLLQSDADHFLYRDFQSRNVMLREGEPWFIDYQGGRRGALPYDVASLLYDAKADLPDGLRQRLLEHYLDALTEYRAVDREKFEIEYRGYVVVRILQALGAYGYRGFFERKPRFLRSVPYAARNLAGIVNRGLPAELPELESVFGRIADRYASELVAGESGPGLTVYLYSFSYRRGYPEDVSGHGGGYVFDCRALPNPGRLEEYRTLTGLDPGVRSFLESREETSAFWDHVRSLVSSQIDTYLGRDFSALTVSFGCTGGQHRSVYFAERLAAHLADTVPKVRVQLHHREEPYWP